MNISKSHRTLLVIAMLFVALSTTSGCRTIEPHERQWLEDPVMSLQVDATEAHFMQKWMYSQEGSFGGRRPAVSQLSLVLIIVASICAPPSLPMRKDEQSDLREALSTAMKARDWTKASSTARKLKSLVDKAGRTEVELILDQIKGHKELDKIVSKAFKAKDLRKVMADIAKVGRKYAKHPTFLAELDRTREMLDEAYYLRLEDFDGRIPDPLRRVSGEGMTKHGKNAASWSSADLYQDATFIQFNRLKFNVADFSHLVFWTKSDLQFRFGVEPMADSRVGGVYHAGFANLPPKKWTEIRLRIGAKGDFTPVRGANWDRFTCVRLRKNTGTNCNLLLDDFRLQRKPAKAKAVYEKLVERAAQ